MEQEFSNLKESVRTLRCENSEVKEENEKLRKDTESLSQVKQVRGKRSLLFFGKCS